MSNKIQCSTISIAPDLDIYHVGPALDKGAMPVVFYFALSGEDSLCLDPFNQPVQFLSDDPIRVISLTLPGHEADLPAVDALKIWAEDLQKNRNIIDQTVEKASAALDFLMEKKLVIPNKVAAMGLSRGGFICSHFAAADDRVRFLLQFAPLTDLSLAKDFSAVKDLPLVKELHVKNLVKPLANRHIRFYIGNRDTRVSTKGCFNFLESLVDEAHKNNIRSPQLEMVISPSIGQHGHGTPPHIFQAGADWLASCLLHK